MEKKRERGPNYSHAEKLLLVDLVTKYKDIIEDKRTGGTFIKRKKEAWQYITNQYNNNCTTGAREVEQLKTLYDNMKQKSRKSVAGSNESEYINTKELLVAEVESQEDLAKALKNLKEEKSEMYKRGAGFWMPETTYSDEEIKDPMQDQVEPLVNPYDSAAGYFKQFQEQYYLNRAPSTSSDPLGIVPNNDDMNQIDPPNKALTPPAVEHRALQKKQIKELTKMKNVNSAEALKRLYFKKKCQNAQLEHKKLKLEILYLKQEHDLRMRVLKNKFSLSEQNK